MSFALRGANHRGGSFGIRPGFLPAAIAAVVVLLTGSAPRALAGAAWGPLADSLDFLREGPVSGAEFGILAYSLDRRETLLAAHERKRLIPGSNAKLFPTGAFLRRFGPEYRASTALLARGKASIKEQGRRIRFEGDLVLRGSGMPDVYQILAPGSRGLLDSLAFLLRASGLERFKGTLWVDGSLFAPEPYGPGWAQEDLVFSYAAPVNAVLANGNAATLIATAGEKEVTLTLEPPEVPLVLSGRPTTGDVGTMPRLQVRRALGSRVIEVSGSVPRGGAARRQVAVPEPDSTAGLMLLGAMRRAGIDVDARARVLPARADVAARDDKGATRLLDQVRSVAPDAAALGWTSVKGDRAAPVLALASPPASEVVAAVNASSLNIEAEALLRLLDPAPVGKTRERGLRELYRMAAEAGVDTLDLSLVDGSGLSPMDLVTARAIVAWLASLERDPRIGPAFREGLARPGAQGTLRNRFQSSPAGSTLSGKTGTLTNVSALSGYVNTKDGERVVFSMLSNGNRGTVAPAHAAEERLVDRIARWTRAKVSTARPFGIPR